MSDQHLHQVTIEPPVANKVIAFVLAGVAVFIALVFITNVDAALFQVAVVVAAAAAGLYAYRTIRTRAVADRIGVTVHNLRHTRQITWSEIDHFAVAHLDHNQGTGIDVVLTDGSRLPVEASWGTWYRSGRADENTKRCEQSITEFEEVRAAAGHRGGDVMPIPSVDVRWLTASIDLPGSRFDEGVHFWTRATRTKLSDPRGEGEEFATLLPADGDPYLKVQRMEAGEPRVHLDLHVDSIERAVERARALGASVVEDRGHVLMRSPAGFPFCIVGDGGETTVPSPEDSATPNRLDQVCIDAPSADFDRECTFWSAFTMWKLNDGARVEFRSLERPDDIPLRILLQRLGREDQRSAAAAHLDFACGKHVTQLLMRHDRYDAERVENRGAWVVMRDPAGLPYCLTSREPDAGASA